MPDGKRDIIAFPKYSSYIEPALNRLSVPFYSRCDFAKLSDYAEVPRNGANDECIPMAIRIRE